MPNNEELIALANRLERVAGRVKGAIKNPDELSAGSQAVVIAMTVTMELGLLQEAAAALRARARAAA